MWKDSKAGENTFYLNQWEKYNLIEAKTEHFLIVTQSNISNTNEHLYSTYSVPGAVLSVFPMQAYLYLTTTPWARAFITCIKKVLLLLSRFSCFRLCVTPQTAVHQALPSLGFSRQEHWSGLPLPSPMQESEKWKWNCSAMSYSSKPHGLQPTRLLCPWDFPGKSTGMGCHCLLHTKVQ